MSDDTRDPLRPTLVVRFGSTVTGRARPDSDIDIGVLCERELTLDERGQIVVDLARRHGLPEDRIDLVDLRTANPILLHEAAENGELLEGDPDDFLHFRVSAWKVYHDTAKLRRARERNLRNRLDVP